MIPALNTEIIAVSLCANCLRKGRGLGIDATCIVSKTPLALSYAHSEAVYIKGMVIVASISRLPRLVGKTPSLFQDKKQQHLRHQSVQFYL